MTTRPVPTAAVILVLALCLLPGFATAQSPTGENDSDLQLGIKTFGSYHGGDLDSIDTTSGKLTVHIPLLSYPQLGRLHLNYSIHYDSPMFTWFNDGIDPPGWLPISSPDTRSAVVRANALVSISRLDTYDPHTGSYLYTNFTVNDPDGESHHMAAMPTSGAATSQLRAIDGSGYYANVTSADWTQNQSPLVYDSNGTVYDSQAG